MAENSIDNAIADRKLYGDPVAQRARLARLRYHDPVHWRGPRGYRPFWTVAEHQDIIEVERHDARFINAKRTKVQGQGGDGRPAQHPTATSTDARRHDQHSRSLRVRRRDRVTRPTSGHGSGRLAKGMALALAVIAGIAVAPCSGAATETSKASRQTSAIAEPSGPVTAERQWITAHRTDPQTVDRDPTTRFVEKLYKQLIRPTSR
jgi:hypothetical protein